MRLFPPDSPPCHLTGGQPTKVPSNHPVCINLQRLHGLSTVKYLFQQRKSSLPNTFPRPDPVKLCCTTSLPGSQHNRVLGWSETETSWMFSMGTSLPKEKGISSTLLLKAVILCFVLGRGCSLAYLCLAQSWGLPTSVLPPLFTGAAHDIPGVSPLLFAWPWADIGCSTVQMNNPRISTTAGAELWL